MRVDDEPPPVGRASRVVRGAAAASTVGRTGVPATHRPPAAGANTSSGRASTPWAIAALLATNALPLFGVAFAGWSVSDLMLLYWFESGVVGLYGLIRILGSATGAASMGGALFSAAFFACHYGAFWTVHGFFVVTLFGDAALAAGYGAGPVPSTALAVFDGPGALPMPFAFFFGGLQIAAAEIRGPLVPVALGMVVSHGVSFVGNVLQGREDAGRSPQELMAQPYARVVLLHVTLLVGGFVILAFGEATGGLLLFAALKTGADLAAHLRAHRPRPAAPPPPPPWATGKDRPQRPG